MISKLWFESRPSRTLAAYSTAPAPLVSVVVRPALGLSRMAPCTCGSRQRYKHCCGKVADGIPAGIKAALSAEIQAEVLLQHADFLLHSGEASKAAELIEPLQPRNVRSAWIAREAAETCMDMHRLHAAQALLQRATELAPGDPETAEVSAECSRLLLRASAWQAAGQTLRAVLDRINARAQQPAASRRIHIVCKLDTIGGTERRALNLYRCLSAHADVTLWSTTPVLAAHAASVPIRQITANAAPAGGSLAVIGTYFACGAWLESAAFDRVVICHNLAEQYQSLGKRLVQIEANPSRPQVKLTFPSNLFRESTGLPGLVEHSSVDVNVFQRSTPRPAKTAGLIVGRHGRAYPLKFHPNDPSFFRALIARGHRVRILGGTAIAPAFANDTGTLPELLALGSEHARDFLASLDVFLYRKHPQFFETGGTVIFEAMAMALPVVAFPELCSHAELIEHGRNGFIVHSEAEAIEVLDRLMRDPALREQVGRAARATIVELMRRQESAIVAYYLGAGNS